MVGPNASRWARDAISGTTPPNRACSSTLEATSSASSVTVPSDPSSAMPTPVSSQELSMARMIIAGSSRPHGVGVGAAYPVVPLAQADVDEARASIQPDRGLVVGSDFEENHSAVGEFEQAGQQPPTDALALVGRIDANGVNLVLVGRFTPEPGDPSIADELVLGAGSHIVIVLGLELAVKRRRRPRVVALEQLRLQLRAPGGVGPVQRGVGDGHRRTASLRCAQGFWRRGGADTAEPAARAPPPSR